MDVKRPSTRRAKPRAGGAVHEPSASSGSKVRAKAIPPVAPTHTNSNAAVPPSLQLLSGTAAETVVHAMLDEGRSWKRRDGKAPIFGDDQGTYVSVGNPIAPLETSLENFAWNRVLALDDATAQTFLYVMARCLSEPAEPGTVRRVRMHTNDILAFRGIQRHHNRDFRPQQKIEERDRMLALTQMWVVGRDVVLEQHGNTMKKKKVKLYSRLIDFEIEANDDGTSIMLPELGQPADVVPYAFRVTLGAWAETYIGAGYVRAMLNRIVQYDPKRTVERIAMRVGLYLHFKPSTQSTVAGLLEGARIEIPQTNPERFRDTFEEALDLLTNDGIIAKWQYRHDDVELPRYKWFDEWLAWEVLIASPATVLKPTK